MRKTVGMVRRARQDALISAMARRMRLRKNAKSRKKMTKAADAMDAKTRNVVLLYTYELRPYCVKMTCSPPSRAWFVVNLILLIFIKTKK